MSSFEQGQSVYGEHGEEYVYHAGLAGGEA